MNEATDVTLSVIDAFERLDIPYLIGGSLASAVHGTARSTLDADLLADIKVEHIDPLVEMLSGDFYIEPEAIRDAIKFRTSFNVIHLPTSFKVDIFLQRNREYDKQQFANRHLITVSVAPERQAYFASAEDTILTKLEWYKLGNEVSETQWRDVIGIIKVKRHSLDVSYLRKHACELNVLDLLEQVLSIE